jgi:hypothetical protein
VTYLTAYQRRCIRRRDALAIVATDPYKARDVQLGENEIRHDSARQTETEEEDLC